MLPHLVGRANAREQQLCKHFLVQRRKRLPVLASRRPHGGRGPVRPAPSLALLRTGGLRTPVRPVRPTDSHSDENRGEKTPRDTLEDADALTTKEQELGNPAQAVDSSRLTAERVVAEKVEPF